MVFLVFFLSLKWLRWNIYIFWCIGFWSIEESQFAEQRGQISGDLCIEGWWNQTTHCSSPCRSELLHFVTASNKLLHLLSHNHPANFDNLAKWDKSLQNLGILLNSAQIIHRSRCHSADTCFFPVSHFPRRRRKNSRRHCKISLGRTKLFWLNRR